MNRAKWTLWLPTTFAVVVLSFFAATAIGQWQMLAMDRGALAIANIAAPGIEHLSSARADIRHLQLLQEEALDRAEHGEVAESQAMSQVRESLADSMNRYFTLPVWPGEERLWGDIFQSRQAHERAIARFEAQIARADHAGARSTLRDEAARSAEALSDAIMNAIELNAGHAHDLALGIQRTRGSAAYSVFSLDLVAMLIAIVGALLLSQAVHTHARLVERHAQMEKERASELEQFAGRVAHDVLSPLNAVSFALELAARQGDEAQRARVIERGTGAVQRVKRLVNGLLEYARAGASPDPNAHADVACVLADLASELQPAATAAGIDLRLGDGRVGYVRCHPGVLTSLISNLVNNAIKYMGDSALRRIDVRVLDRGDRMRVEVEDTGPGLSADIACRVFEPYARAANATQPGVGLGLATVKRLAESHGGQAGVHSVLGKGSKFWFELPKASVPELVPATA